MSSPALRFAPRASPGGLVRLGLAVLAAISATFLRAQTPPAPSPNESEALRQWARESAKDQAFIPPPPAPPARRATDAERLREWGLKPADVSQDGWSRFCRWAHRVAVWVVYGTPLVLGMVFLLRFFGGRLVRPAPRRNAAEKGDPLPNLQLLQCAPCGGVLPLSPDVLECPSCGHTTPAPAEYGATVRQRAAAAAALHRAVAQWRRANVATAPPFLWGWNLLGLAFLILALVGTYSKAGRELFPPALEGETLSLFTVICGAAAWLTCVFYSQYLIETRRELPVAGTTPKLGAEEIITCHNCAGAVRLGAHDIDGVCGYCGTEAYRVALTRRARHVAGAQEHLARVSLHDAMSIVTKRRRELFELLLSFTAVSMMVCIAFLFFVKAVINGPLVLATLALLFVVGWVMPDKAPDKGAEGSGKPAQ